MDSIELSPDLHIHTVMQVPPHTHHAYARLKRRKVRDKDKKIVLLQTM